MKLRPFDCAIDWVLTLEPNEPYSAPNQPRVYKTGWDALAVKSS